MATMYIIGTPIGNLEDITLRALRVLKEVDVILCEDTRITKRLLNRFEINNLPAKIFSKKFPAGKQLTTYNEKRSGVGIEKIMKWLEEGKNLALVSDAGTPGISDPGARLVKAAREAGFPVVPIPGPSALTAALSVSGLSGDNFLFLGFLPHKKGRETLFKEIAASKRTVVFYESPHRIIKTLEALSRYLARRGGPSEGRKVVIARELTKIHEEVVRGSAQEILVYFKNNPDHVRGEFVVIISV